MKWLWWALIIGLAIWIARGTRIRVQASVRRGPIRPPVGVAAPGPVPPPSPPGRQSREIVPCAHCGVHLPREEAIASPEGALLYCSEAHRIAHVARRRAGQSQA